MVHALHISVPLSYFLARVNIMNSCRTQMYLSHLHLCIAMKLHGTPSYQFCLFGSSDFQFYYNEPVSVLCSHAQREVSHYYKITHAFTVYCDHCSILVLPVGNKTMRITVPPIPSQCRENHMKGIILYHIVSITHTHCHACIELLSRMISCAQYSCQKLVKFPLPPTIKIMNHPQLCIQLLY